MFDSKRLTAVKIRGNATLHRFDRYLGIPLVAFLGSTRLRRKIPSCIRRIGLLKSGAIGDTVLLSAVILDFQQAYPDAEIVLFCGETNYEIAQMLSGVDRVVQVPLGNLGRALSAIRSVPVDVLLDFGQWSRLEALFACASRNRYSVGFKTPGQSRHFCFDLAVEHSREVHEMENYRSIVRAIGIPADHQPSIVLQKAPRLLATEYAVCHLWPGGTRSELKEWPSSHWNRLFAHFLGQGLDVVLTGAPSDFSRNQELIAAFPASRQIDFHNIAGQPLRRSAEWLVHAEIVVSVNTGLMHLAAALGVPVIGLHGPTSAKRWGPVGESAIAISSRLPGSGYLHLGSEYPAAPPPCMDHVLFEDVQNACDSLLMRTQSSTQNVGY